MRNRILGLVLSLTFLIGVIPAAYAAEEVPAEAPVEAADAVDLPAPEITPENPLDTPEAPVEVPDAPVKAPAVVLPENGAAVSIDGMARSDFYATVFGGTAYVPMTQAAAAIRPGVTAAWENDRAVVRGEGLTLSAKAGNCFLEVNGRFFFVADDVKMTEDGLTLVPARVLAQALGCTISWDGAVHFTTGGPLPESGDTFYDPQSVDLLARVIVHESGFQPFKGQIAVGNVILARVASPRFPNTIYDVIYEPNQFPGATNKEPDAEAIVAAKLCLEGTKVVDGAYYFNGADKPCWASRNKTLVAVIGGHAFYG